MEGRRELSGAEGRTGQDPGSRRPACCVQGGGARVKSERYGGVIKNISGLCPQWFLAQSFTNP